MIFRNITEALHRLPSRACHAFIAIGPQKYNELYAKIKNLNRLLAWGHAKALEKAGWSVADLDVVETMFSTLAVQMVQTGQAYVTAGTWRGETYVAGRRDRRPHTAQTARAAFYRVYVDTGAGAEYWGLYTMVEDPADGAMLDSQLGGHEGNLYKPEGAGSDWTRFTQAGFAKKTNEKAADWGDVERAIAGMEKMAQEGVHYVVGPNVDDGAAAVGTAGEVWIVEGHEGSSCL